MSKTTEDWLRDAVEILERKGEEELAACFRALVEEGESVRDAVRELDDARLSGLARKLTQANAEAIQAGDPDGLALASRPLSEAASAEMKRRNPKGNGGGTTFH